MTTALVMKAFLNQSLSTLIEPLPSLYGMHDTPSTIDPFVVYGRFLVFGISLSLWLCWWAQKTDIGKDVFGYKGDDKWLQLRRQIAIYSWWWQSSLILLSLTWHNNLWIDSLTIMATLSFCPYYDEYPKMRTLFGLTHKGWDYFFSLIFLLSHHVGISYVILFESDSNKHLYRLPFVWLWWCHSLRQILLKYASCITPYITLDSIWTIYWKIGPYLLGYWYVFDFMQSDNEYLSTGLLMLLFGRWTLSFNWPENARWPKEERWTDETCQSMIHLALAYMYHHGIDVSCPMAVTYALFVCCLHQARDPKASKSINYSWSE